MITLEHKDTMEQNFEASLKYPQTRVFPYNLHSHGNPVESVPVPEEEISGYPSGNIAEPDHLQSNDSFEPSKEFYSKLNYQCDFGSWANFHYNCQKMQHCPLNAFGNQFYHLMNNKLQYSSLNTFPQGQGQGYPYEFQFQDFQYFVVIDFEATCDKEKIPHPQEIIEFPSVIVSSVTGQLEACFQTYVRPTCNQLLSDFCKDLTGIQQIQVDRGVTLSEALLRHDKWLEAKGIKNTNFAVVTWSNWDCHIMLESECRYKKIRKPPYFNRWINLRVPFRQVFGGVRCNLKEAVQHAGLTWQGRAHSGLDDAKNTARLLALLMQRGFKFSITNSLTWGSAKQSQEHPPSATSPLHKQNNLLHIHQLKFHPCCLCGVRSGIGMVRKPGSKQDSIFFGCGNWTASTGPRCHYLQWASDLT